MLRMTELVAATRLVCRQRAGGGWTERGANDEEAAGGGVPAGGRAPMLVECGRAMVHRWVGLGGHRRTDGWARALAENRSMVGLGAARAG
jgi:hypothetical protein